MMSTTQVYATDKAERRTLNLKGGEHSIALRCWMKGYTKNAYENHACEKAGIDPTESSINVVWPEQRDLNSTVPQQGEYLIGDDLPKFHQTKQRQEDSIYSSATVVRESADAGDLAVPRAIDDNNEGSYHPSGEIVAGNLISTSEPNFDRTTLRSSPFYSSGINAFSRDLLRSVLLERIVGETNGTRIARKRGRHHAIGTGTGEPYGIFVAIPASQEVTSTVTLGPTEPDFKNMMLALAPPYRVNAKWIMHSQVFASIVELRANGLQTVPVEWGPRPKLHGHEVILCDFAPTSMTASTRTIVFADVSKYLIREIGPMVMYRYNEGTINSLTGVTNNLAERNCVGFQSQIYSDAAWTDAAAGVVLAMKP